MRFLAGRLNGCYFQCMINPYFNLSHVTGLRQFRIRTDCSMHLASGIEASSIMNVTFDKMTNSLSELSACGLCRNRL